MLQPFQTSVTPILVIFTYLHRKFHVFSHCHGNHNMTHSLHSWIIIYCSNSAGVIHGTYSCECVCVDFLIYFNLFIFINSHMWGLYGNCKLLQPSMFVEWFFGIPDFQIYFIALGVWRPKLLLCDSLSLHFESGFCKVNTSFMVFNVTYYLESHNTIIFLLLT